MQQSIIIGKSWWSLLNGCRSVLRGTVVKHSPLGPWGFEIVLTNPPDLSFNERQRAIIQVKHFGDALIQKGRTCWVPPIEVMRHLYALGGESRERIDAIIQDLDNRLYPSLYSLSPEDQDAALELALELYIAPTGLLCDPILHHS